MQRHTICSTLLILLLAACGTKGPLILPADANGAPPITNERSQ